MSALTMIFPALTTSIYLDPSSRHLDYISSTGHRFPSVYADLVVNTIHDLKMASASLKLAVVTKWYVNELETWIDQDLPHLLAAADRIYLALPEGYVLWQEQHQHLKERLDHEKIVMLTVDVPGHSWQHARHCDYYPWLTSTWYANGVIWPERLRVLDHDPGREAMLFDCLMGVNKPWRTSFYETLQRFDVIDRGLLSYQQRPDQPMQEVWIQTPSLPIVVTPENEGVPHALGLAMIPTDDLVPGSLPLEQRDFSMVFANGVIDTDIYNRTFFSVVVESHNFPGVFFFTEKVAKPMIAQRLFVLAAPAGSLQKLRDLGFKTFGSVIDETYDNIQDDALRFLAVARLIHHIGTLDRGLLYQQILPILQHNRARIQEFAHWPMPSGMFMAHLADLGFDPKFSTHGLGRCRS